MCGIVAVLSRIDDRPSPDVPTLAKRLAQAAETIRDWGNSGLGGSSNSEGGDRALDHAVSECETIAADFRGFAGLRPLLENPDALQPSVQRLTDAATRFEQLLDQSAGGIGTARVEALNAVLVRLKDAAFALDRDRLGNVEKVLGLAGGSTREEHLRAAYDCNVALNALDRLEVRGRDSAGLNLLVRGDFESLLGDIEDEVADRTAIALFTHEAVRRTGDAFSFVYKVAAEVGELGDNVQSLRAAISGDPLLHRLLDAPNAKAEILGHTRWASVGVISEPNAHPLNQELEDKADGPFVIASLNGDVDNYRNLIETQNLSVAPEITTDAKVIPALVSRAIADGDSALDAFRKTVGRFEGSVAIGCSAATDAAKLYLALRGSGQALYIGLADNAYLVASEPYGIVEETSRYVRLDGETPADPDDPSTRGQIVVLDGTRAGTPDGIRRLTYGGDELPVQESDLRKVDITTRDIDRGEHRHFLHKELSEAPLSIRKTLRGRVLGAGAKMRVALGDDILPPAIRERLAAKEFQRVRVIGQGTAAVAGQGVAEAIREALVRSDIVVDALPASEVSGFHLRDDMSDTLFVAISQSGTTTDTNRTVDLLRSRGAAVIGIVNRRHSDLTERVDGVLYTSDGRDVEMSVASTKAFYSQIAAGILLGEAIAEAAGVLDVDRSNALLLALHDLPDQMRVVLDRHADVKTAADKFAPPRRHWALVGNGRNLIAAEEIRIKLSELCYKSIACDATEDKKHIDLSSEPMILVCAAGLEGGNASDVAKEVEIYAAHKACPIVVASDSSGEWRAAAATLRVPDTHPDLAFILGTMVGHLFGYYAAQAIDDLALPLRQARGVIEIGALAPAGGDFRDALAKDMQAPKSDYIKGLRSGRYNGALEASTASRLALLFRYADRSISLDYFADDFGVPGTPGAAIEELTNALTEGIEELVRPIDAIKHQAKTVTVGISRGDEALLTVPLVRAVIETGVARERLAYRDLKILQALNGAVEEVLGFTRYAIEGASNGGTIRVVEQGGSAQQLSSRTTQNKALRGTKNTVAMEKRVLVAVGRSDQRPIVLVPENSKGVCTGIVLLHTKFRQDLDQSALREVLSGYRNRYALIRDALIESNVEFDDSYLTRINVLRLLTEPVLMLADELSS